MSEEDEYLRKFKPEGEDAHYYACVACGCGPDGSLIFSEFGLCLKCVEEYRKKIPRRIEAHIGRLLLFGKIKGDIPTDIKERFHRITEAGCKVEGKDISKHKPIYKEACR